MVYTAVSTPSATIAPDSLCPHCNSDQLFTRIEAPHTALRCASCNRWIKWIRRREAERFTSEPPKHSQPLQPKLALVVPKADEPPAREQPACNHSEQIERLLDRMTKIDRALSVVVRAMMNGLRPENDGRGS